MDDSEVGVLTTSNPQKLSKYNSSLAQLFRIDALWQKVHLCAGRGDLMGWNWTLDRIWCELVADSKKEDENEFNRYVIEISKVIDKKELLYHILMSKEAFLRKLQNAQGKGTAYQEDIEEYMG